MTEHAITGGAYDSDELDEALNVNITIKNEETGKEVLNQSVKVGIFVRSCLTTIKAMGNHGFTLNVDWPSAATAPYIPGYGRRMHFFQHKNLQLWKSGCSKEEADSKASSSVRSLGTLRPLATVPAKAVPAPAVIPVQVPRLLPGIPSSRPFCGTYGSKNHDLRCVDTAEDKVASPGPPHIDIFYDTHSESKHHGVRDTEVFWSRA